MTCPNCGHPLPRIVAGMPWHARSRARAALSHHLEDWPARRCSDRPQRIPKPQPDAP